MLGSFIMTPSSLHPCQLNWCLNCKKCNNFLFNIVACINPIQILVISPEARILFIESELTGNQTRK